MTQTNGLSPRGPKPQNQSVANAENSRTSCNSSSVTPSSIRSGRFFHSSAPSGAENHVDKAVVGTEGRSSWKGHSNVQIGVGSMAKLRAAVASHRQPSKGSAMRLLVLVATMVCVVPFLCPGSSASSVIPALPEPLAAARTATTTAEDAAAPVLGRDLQEEEQSAPQNGCAAFQSWDGILADRAECKSLLPASVVEGQGWLVAVHVDRAPSSTASRLRGARTTSSRRSLPHQYYVRAMEATLHSIASVEPGATVDIATFTEGRWGSVVDEMGVPLDWDVPNQICTDLGLHCTQTVVMLNEAAPSIPEALECIAAADVLVASESDFSRAAATLSEQIKVLTDRWEMDEDEMMITLSPATTIAGMPASDRGRLKTLVRNYHKCSVEES